MKTNYSRPAEGRPRPKVTIMARAYICLQKVRLAYKLVTTWVLMSPLKSTACLQIGHDQSPYVTSKKYALPTNWSQPEYLCCLQKVHLAYKLVMTRIHMLPPKSTPCLQIGHYLSTNVASKKYTLPTNWSWPESICCLQKVQLAYKFVLTWVHILPPKSTACLQIIR